MPDSITEIGSYAFENRINLSDVKISENLSTMGYRAFIGCTALKEIDIPKSLSNVTSYYGTQTCVFVNSGLKTVTFEEGTTVFNKIYLKVL